MITRIFFLETDKILIENLGLFTCMAYMMEDMWGGYSTGGMGFPFGVFA